MMHTTGFHSGMQIFIGLHMLGMVLGLAGFILLMAWAIKHLSGADQKKWGIVLIVAGLAACLLSCLGFALAGFDKGDNFRMKIRGGANGMMMQESGLKVQ